MRVPHPLSRTRLSVMIKRSLAPAVLVIFPVLVATVALLLEELEHLNLLGGLLPEDTHIGEKHANMHPACTHTAYQIAMGPERHCYTGL